MRNFQEKQKVNNWNVIFKSQKGQVEKQLESISHSPLQMRESVYIVVRPGCEFLNHEIILYFLELLWDKLSVDTEILKKTMNVGLVKTKECQLFF